MPRCWYSLDTYVCSLSSKHYTIHVEYSLLFIDINIYNFWTFRCSQEYWQLLTLGLETPPPPPILHLVFYWLYTYYNGFFDWLHLLSCVKGRSCKTWWRKYYCFLIPPVKYGLIGDAVRFSFSGYTRTQRMNHMIFPPWRSISRVG